MTRLILAWRNTDGTHYTAAQAAADKRAAFIAALRTMSLDAAMTTCNVNKAALGNWRARHMAFKHEMDEITGAQKR